jgi:dihydrodipicolinate reductase
MKVILFGATGMVGQGVLRECLLDPNVEAVLVVGRSASGRHHSKLREIVSRGLVELH